MMKLPLIDYFTSQRYFAQYQVIFLFCILFMINLPLNSYLTIGSKHIISKWKKITKSHRSTSNKQFQTRNPEKQWNFQQTEFLDTLIQKNTYLHSKLLIIQQNIIFLPLNYRSLTLMPSSIQLLHSTQLNKTFSKNNNFPVSQQFKENWNPQKEIEKEIYIARKSQSNKTVFFPSVNKTQNISSFQKLVHSNVQEIIMKEFIVNLYKGVKYAMKSLRGPNQDSILKKRVKLNEKSGSSKKFLFMDLDETLIYTNRQKNIRVDSNESTHFQLYIRPYAIEFLRNISNYYDVYVFTAATRQYAEAAIKKLDKNSMYIQDFLCRDDCFKTHKGKIIKDLRIVQNRQLKDMILVDNKSQSFGLQLENGVPILDFYGSENDEELIHLEKTLIKLAQVPDVRKAIQKHYKLNELAEFSKEDLHEYLMSGTSPQKLEEKISIKQLN